ncbi:energy-coupling factor transporter transmembrane component T family protein [Clostridium sp. Cult2]|uniref:energy-coupling factor transporter transmembrane component T family protein n=1 Tax=Clostridium sp. Cult2 TaxID=2079003 RepID=UPI001F3860E0|nr:energy-coupling factor transporter transmembrane component T [Clostridium sp. Cult2]MCF6465526.1 energy-coupling factor transporter transmembrane protein EcfT [Clostridium sp. Cult2]
MTKGYKLDPRTKLIIVLCISTLGIIIKDILSLAVILVLTIFIAKSFNVDLKRSLKKIQRLVYLIIVIAIIQSIFSSEGKALFSIGNFIVLSTSGLEKGLQFILRMMIIIFSATIITTSNSREIIQGFVQWGLPYDIAFMVAIGIRFLPILTEEIKDSLTAIQLRGIEINNIPIKKRISIYSYIFNPILVGTILKAEKLSTTIEMRGFRAYDSRTSYLVLKMSKWDYFIIFISIIFTICYIAFNIFR